LLGLKNRLVAAKAWREAEPVPVEPAPLEPAPSAAPANEGGTATEPKIEPVLTNTVFTNTVLTNTNINTIPSVATPTPP